MQSAQIHLCTEYVYRLFHLQAMQMIWYEHESDFREFRCDLELNARARLARLPFVPVSSIFPQYVCNMVAETFICETFIANCL